MKKLLFISSCSLLFIISCRKEKLPKLTEEGKNTFGCKINGRIGCRMEQVALVELIL